MVPSERTCCIAPFKTSLSPEIKYITAKISAYINSILIINFKIRFGGDVIKNTACCRGFPFSERAWKYIDI